jgi:hypothetical protein
MDEARTPPFPSRDTAALIGATIDLFIKHFTAFAWTTIAPALAINILNVALGEQPVAVSLLLAIPVLVAELVIWSATTLVSVGAALGHVPDVATAYRCALRSPLLTLFASMMLVLALVVGGSLLLIVPGLVALVMTVLVPVIVVVERRATWDSLRRSRALGSGFYLRNLFIVVILFVPAVVGAYLVSSLEVENPVIEVGLAVLSTVLQTLSMLATVLVYIDMRARKEQLDPTTLALEIGEAYGEPP